MNTAIRSVTCLKTLVHSADARVAEFEIGPHTEGEVHHHSTATEHCICLQGQLQIKSGTGPARSLKPGEMLEIPAGESHQVINPGADPCRYLVVQHGGAYDFVTG